MLLRPAAGSLTEFNLVHSTSLESKSFSELRVQFTTASSPYLAWTTLGSQEVFRSEENFSLRLAANLGILVVSRG